MAGHAFRVFVFRPAPPPASFLPQSFERWLFERLSPSQRRSVAAAAMVLLPSWGPSLSRTSLGTRHGPRLHELRLRLRRPEPRTLRIFYTQREIAGRTALILLAGGADPPGRRASDVLPGLGDARWRLRELAHDNAAGLAVAALRPCSSEATRSERPNTHHPERGQAVFVDARELWDAVAAEALSESEDEKADLRTLETRYRTAAVFLHRRAELGVGQQRLATAARVPRDTISELENGQANPSLSTLTALAAALGCTLDLGLRPHARSSAEY